MSAMFDALKQEAFEREAAGFATMRVEPIGFFLEAEDPWSTANRSVVSSGTAIRSFVVAYSAPKVNRGRPMGDWDAGLGRLGVVRSDSFLVRLEGNPATMGVGAMLMLELGASQERGVIVFDIPRKKVYSQQVSFFTADLKRKSPRGIQGGRAHGEDNA